MKSRFKTIDGNIEKDEGLKELNLSYNKIAKIENLNEGLQILNLGDNEIAKIENLNEGLQELYLSYNKIAKIENLNEGLQELYLWNNKIAKISKDALDLIKKNKINVYGVDVDMLEVEE